MVIAYKKKANYSLIIFLITLLIEFVLGFLLINQILQGNQNLSFVNNPLVSTIGIVNYISLFVGIYFLAKAKGYSGLLALLGFLYLLGLIIMFFLKDKTDKTTKNKSNKKVIIIAVIIIALGIGATLLSSVIKQINPEAKFAEATLKACKQECASSNDSTCINKCMEKSGLNGAQVNPNGEWVAFDSPVQNYSIDFPGQPSTKENSVALDEYTKVIETIHGYDTPNKISYFTTSLTFPDNYNANLNEISKSIIDNKTVNVGAKLISSDKTEFQGQPAIEFVAQMPKDYYIKYKVFFIGNNLYTLAVASSSQDFPDFDKFVNSFKYTGN